MNDYSVQVIVLRILYQLTHQPSPHHSVLGGVLLPHFTDEDMDDQKHGGQENIFPSSEGWFSEQLPSKEHSMERGKKSDFIAGET